MRLAQPGAACLDCRFERYWWWGLDALREAVVRVEMGEGGGWLLTVERARRFGLFSPIIASLTPTLRCSDHQVDQPLRRVGDWQIVQPFILTVAAHRRWRN